MTAPHVIDSIEWKFESDKMSSSQGEVLGLQQMKSQSKSNISVY